MEEKKRNQCFIFLMVVGTVLLFFPLLTLGIMHNDELLARYWSMRGVKEFLTHSYTELLQGKGRAMSCLVVPVTQILGYIGKSRYCFRILQVLTVISNIGLFAKLTEEIFHKKTLTGIVTVLLALFMPLSFEPTLPNAYVTLYGIPLTLLYVSLLLYIYYLRTEKKKYMIIAMILFWIVCCSYEAFITYTPVFLLLGITERHMYSWKKIKENIKPCLVPIIVGCVFLACYVVTGKIFPSQYDGTQIGFNLKASLVIIKNLLRSAVPGGLFLSDKYLYLFNYYKHWLSTEGVIRVIAILMIAGYALWKIFRKEVEKEKKELGKSLLILVMLLGCAVLPFLPISVSKMYQGNVGEQGFISLPVSYFSYFVMTLAFSYIVWGLTRFIRFKKVISVVMLVGILSLGCAIQLENDIFSREMDYDFTRLEIIVAHFRTDTINEYNGKEICSKEIYQAYNTLAVHDSYWTDYAQLQGKNISVLRADHAGPLQLYATSAELFTVVDKENGNYVAFSRTQISDTCAMKVGWKQYIYLDPVESPQKDGDYYIYRGIYDKKDIHKSEV